MESDQPDLYFYHLQRRAPKPVPVLNEACLFNVTTSVPKHYGCVFHGTISRQYADELVLKHGNGAYLVRESLRQRKQYTLVLLFDGEVKNFRLYFDGAHHYVADKLYETLEDLVADGLICYYCEKYGRSQIERMTVRRSSRTQSASHSIYSEPQFAPIGKTNPEQQRPASSEIKQRKSMALLGDADGVFTAVEPVKSKHDFRVTTFFGPHWCAVCNNYMWGLVSQGVKCSKCGMAIHKICVESVGDYCRPDRKLIKIIMGCDLSVVCMAFRTHVCFVVQMCIQEIERREGEHIEGIYRIGGGNADIIKITEEIERNQEAAKIDSTQFPDIHTVTNYLKKYLRSLPVPVINFDQHDSLIEIFRDTPQMDYKLKLEKVSNIIQSLDVYHFANFETIMKHLNKIASHSHANKMTSHNLGTIFGQSLLRAVSEDMSQPLKMASSLADMRYQNEVISFVIENSRFIFTPS